MQLSSDVLEFIQLLNKHNARYLVVGGWAFSLLAKPRYTKDIDILIERSNSNAQKLMTVLHDFGFGSLDITADDFKRPGYVIQLGVEPNRIDILTDIVAVDFTCAWARKESADIDGITLPILSRKDLLANKLAAGRDQDLADAKFLKKML